MLLMEVFDKPFEWERMESGGTSYVAEFDTGEIRYELEAHETGGDADESDYYTMEFTAHFDNHSSQDITNTGKSLQVFATVTVIVRDFIKRNKPNVILFTAKEPSRVKLYDRLAKLFVAAGFSLEVDTSGQHNKQYWLER